LEVIESRFGSVTSLSGFIDPGTFVLDDGMMESVSLEEL
jgi:hypothetical protein